MQKKFWSLDTLLGVSKQNGDFFIYRIHKIQCRVKILKSLYMSLYMLFVPFFMRNLLVKELARHRWTLWSYDFFAETLFFGKNDVCRTHGGGRIVELTPDSCFSGSITGVYVVFGLIRGLFPLRPLYIYLNSNVQDIVS